MRSFLRRICGANNKPAVVNTPSPEINKEPAPQCNAPEQTAGNIAPLNNEELTLLGVLVMLDTLKQYFQAAEEQDARIDSIHAAYAAKKRLRKQKARINSSSSLPACTLL